MKNLAFSTLGCPTWTFPQILHEAKSRGFESIEIRGILENVSTDSLPILKPENIAETKSMLDKAGISVCSLGASASFHDTKKLQTSLNECAFAVQAAKALGIRYIRVFGDRYPEDGDITPVADGLREACKLAEGTGIGFLIETHGGFYNGDRLLALVEKTDRPELGVLWDIEHTFKAGEDNFRFIDRAYPLIRHVHFKNIDAEQKLCLPSKGVIDLKAAARYLMDKGYQGLFSLEWEKRWHPEIESPEEALEDYCMVMGNDGGAS